jgi:uncharacterized membrane protein
MVEIIPNWHPIFVHFTVALLSLAVLLSVIVSLLPDGQLRQQWQWVAQWNLWLGTGITLLTVAAGVVAYNTVTHDTPSHEAMTEHRNWALATAALFVVLAIWSWRRTRAEQAPGGVLLAGLVLAGALLAATAWHGGELVYRYGLGVQSLPKASAHSHAAGAEHDHDHHADGSEHDHAPAATSAAPQELGAMGEDCELPEDKAAATEQPAAEAPPHAEASPHPHDHDHHEH